MSFINISDSSYKVLGLELMQPNALSRSSYITPLLLFYSGGIDS